jgi:hypothetical protein
MLLQDYPFIRRVGEGVGAESAERESAPRQGPSATIIVLDTRSLEALEISIYLYLIYTISISRDFNFFIYLK